MADGGDPAGVQSAIDRYRDLAKYLITIFAGVGALLVAGTQLASIGDLSFEDAPERVIAAAVGLVLAVAAVAVIVRLALRTLQPVDMTFDSIAGDAALAAQIEQRPLLLGGAGSVAEVRDNLDTTALSDEERDSWYMVADQIVAYAAYLRTRATFEGTWRPMLFAAVAGVLGITAFTWGANPPEDTSSSATVEPAPVTVRVSLTEDGQDALADALGGGECAVAPIPALAIGGTRSAPKVVTLPHGTCKAAQFTLPAEWGAATRQDPSLPK
jgi:hypothetical protein